MRPSLVVVVALALAGCLDAAPAHDAPTWKVSLAPAGAADAQLAPSQVAPATLTTARTAPGTARLTDGLRLDVAASCTVSCPVLRFDNAVPADPRGWIDVRLDWDGTATPGFTAELRGAGNVTVQRGFDSLRLTAWNATPGLVDLHVEGAGDVSGWIRAFHLDAPRGDGQDLLPNLVTLTPEDVAIRSCLIDERLERGAERCLRLSNGIGNTGDGPMEVHLSIADGTLAAAGLGQFVQRVFQADGSFRDEPVAGAQFHFTHAHFHYQGVARFQLFDYDLDTGLRGAEVGADKKAGFCLIDIGRMEAPDVEPEEDPAWQSDQWCLVPNPIEPLDGWSMGISRGWYDYYVRGLSDQYVEVTGVPDGTYELVSTADVDGTLIELDTSDNAASVVLEMRGDDVTVLEERAFYFLEDE